MMKIEDIKQLKSLIKPLTPASKAGVDLLGVCKAKNPKINHLCFINGNGPLEELITNLGNLDKSFPQKMSFIVDEKFYQKKKAEFSFIPDKNIFISQDFDRAMCVVSKFFYDYKYENDQYLLDGRQTGEVKICPSAKIAQSVFIGEHVDIASNVVIMPGCVIMGRVSIGPNTIIYPNCVLYPETTIGTNCAIHANSVIGSDGFGYNYMDGEHRKVWHIGGVEIGNNVEVGSNCSIDRGTFDNTIIESETKLDNLVHIAHNCHLKKGVIVCAQSGLAGSATIGNFTAMSGHVAIAPGIEIGDQCEIVGHSAVFDNADSKTRLAGSPARPMKEWLRTIAVLRRLTKKGS